MIENVCPTGYSVSYRDQCKVVPQTQCKQGGGCKRVPRKLCTKVPKYPAKQCRNIPRVEGKCKKVPVKRPTNKCVPVEREVCTEVPVQEVIKRCVYTNQPSCTQTPVNIVRNVCEEEEKEVCPDAQEVCSTYPNTVCQEVTVQQPRKVTREVCQEEFGESASQPLNIYSVQP